MGGEAYSIATKKTVLLSRSVLQKGGALEKGGRGVLKNASLKSKSGLQNTRRGILPIYFLQGLCQLQ